MWTNVHSIYWVRTQKGSMVESERILQKIPDINEKVLKAGAKQIEKVSGRRGAKIFSINLIILKYIQERTQPLWGSQRFSETFTGKTHFSWAFSIFHLLLQAEIIGQIHLPVTGRVLQLISQIIQTEPESLFDPFEKSHLFFLLFLLRYLSLGLELGFMKEEFLKIFVLSMTGWRNVSCT